MYNNISEKILNRGVGIVMRLISRKSEKDILKVKLYCIRPADEDEETYSFENRDGYLFLNYEDEIVLYFMPTNYGFLFQMKTVTCGTNSDNYFMGSVEIGFIGQLLEKGILEWELDNE